MEIKDIYGNSIWSNTEIVTLAGANLTRVNLTGANLTKVNLTGARLYGAYLTGAHLAGANLTGARNIPDYVRAITTITPENDFYGWKKLWGNKLAFLFIPKSAKRSNATGRKCRASKAKVIRIESLNGKETFATGTSIHCDNFIYTVGSYVHADSWTEDRWIECGHGIHFFLTRYEAEQYF